MNVFLKAAVALVLGMATLTVAGAAGSANPDSASFARRLTQDQYRQSIADVFGPDIKIVGRFEPDLRRGGMLAVGSTAVSVTSVGLEQYDQMARGIAAQVVDQKHRGQLIPCTPKVATSVDKRCATLFFSRTGRLVLRRPLTPAELRTYVDMAASAAKVRGDFHAGLATSLAMMLTSPEFLFRIETGVASPATGGDFVLDGWSRASRLSFLLWNSTPDDGLLTAAAKGTLETNAGLQAQVDRMIASPKFERGVRAFFIDHFGFDSFEALSKDGEIYPKFSARVASDAREQALRLIVDHLVRRDEDYRALFTTRKTFMSRTLGPIYRVPVSAMTGWQPYEFDASDERAGLLSQAGMLMIHSHPGRSSPTLRGKAIRETLLCQQVPAPPANVDFAAVQDTKNPLFKTARLRLSAHNSEPLCAGCHKLTDPLGLPLEQFDSAGEFRRTENGAPIDASGEHRRKKFSGVAGLGQALHDDPQVAACLVERSYAYASGRLAEGVAQEAGIERFKEDFRKSGYRFPDLMRTIATSPELQRISRPRPASPQSAGH